MREAFSNLFGGHAEAYSKFRPESPRSLGAFVAQNAPDTERALDCGTGNGQAARMLTEFFQRVDGIDASREQIENATPHNRVTYQISPAEKLPFGDDAMSAVVCATALHWFDFDRFIEEIRRVLKPSGVFVAWTYARAASEPAIESVVTTLARDVIGSYWDPRVKDQLKMYQGALPFDAIEAPTLEIRKSLTLQEFTGYLSTWSAFQSYVRDRGQDPLDSLFEPLALAWGEEERRSVVWELHIIAGRI